MRIFPRPQAYIENHTDGSEKIVDDVSWLRTTLETERRQADERLREVLLEIADEIPEAYGWGKEDEEADRGYQICSKDVKAMIRKRAKDITPKTPEEIVQNSGGGNLNPNGQMIVVTPKTPEV
jgi:hypothetical protein